MSARGGGRGGGVRNVGLEGGMARQDFHMILFLQTAVHSVYVNGAAACSYSRLLICVQCIKIKYLKELGLKGGLGVSPIKFLVLFVQNGAILGNYNY